MDFRIVVFLGCLLMTVQGAYFGSNRRATRPTHAMAPQQVTPVNVAPTILTYAGPTNNLTIDENQPIIVPYPIKINDDATPSCASLTVHVFVTEISVGNQDMFPLYSGKVGSLSFWPGYGSLDPTNVDNAASILMTGTLSQINWGLSNLKYVPYPYKNGVESISVEVVDGGSCIDGNSLPASQPNMVYVTTLPTNAPPIVRLAFSYPSPASPTFNVYQDTLVPLNFSIVDPNAWDLGGKLTQKIWVNVTAVNGIFTTQPITSGGSPTAQPIIYNDTATFKSVSAIADTLMMTIFSNVNFRPSPPDFYGIARLIIDADDLGYRPADHGTNRSRFVVLFNVSKIPAEPAVYFNFSAISGVINEDAVSFPFPLTITDTRADARRQRVDYLAATIRLTAGSLTFNSLYSSLVRFNATANAWTLYGTVAQVIAAANQATYTPPADFFGAVNVTVDVDVVSNVATTLGAPIPHKYNSTVFTFVVNSVNDAPRINSTYQSLRLAVQNQPVNFTDLFIYDVDALTSADTYTLNITARGNITLGRDPASLNISGIQWQNQKQIVVDTTMSNINTLLLGMTYRNIDPWTTDSFLVNVNAQTKFPSDTILIQVNDKRPNGLAVFTVTVTAGADYYPTCQDFLNVHSTSYCGCYYVTTTERAAPGSPWIVLPTSVASGLVMRSEQGRGRFVQGCCGLYTPTERDSYLTATGKLGLCTGQEIATQQV